MDGGALREFGSVDLPYLDQYCFYLLYLMFIDQVHVFLCITNVCDVLKVLNVTFLLK